MVIVKSPKLLLKLGRSQLIAFVIIILLALVLLPQLEAFSESLHLLGEVKWTFATYAALLVALTYFAAAATYCLLAFSRLPYYRTVVAQFAAMFLNRLLPSGVGALGVNYAYLHKMRHTPAQAAAVIGVNNLFGLLGHGLVFGVMVTIFHADLPVLNLPAIVAANFWVAMTLVLAVGAILLIIPKLRFKILSAIKEIIEQLSLYRHRPERVFAALSSSTLLTLCNMFSLFLCVQALGSHLSFVAVVIVFTVGIAVGTAIPTPGGLGGLEAGMVAGFIAYGVSSGVALAAVILYRLISYWLTLVIGAVAFMYCQRRNYFGLS